MARIHASEAREDFAETLNKVAYQGERVVLHRRGKDVAAIVPIEDLTLLETLEDRIDLEQARKALSEAKRSGSFSWEKLKKELGL